MAKNFLIPLGDAYLFHSNLSLSDRCLHASNKLPTFYQELIILWTEICSTEPKNLAEILGQSLWNNKFIRCKDKPIFYRQFSDRGINTISDLITEDRKFLRWSQSRDKYQLPNKDVMKWLGLIESIPRPIGKVSLKMILAVLVEPVVFQMMLESWIKPFLYKQLPQE